MKKALPTKKNNEKKEQVSEILISSETNILWVDSLDISTRSDGLVLIRLVANLPEGMIEQSKVITTQINLKKTITNICEILNYYPEPLKISNDEPK